jgi:hypothetical protein
MQMFQQPEVNLRADYYGFTEPQTTHLWVVMPMVLRGAAHQHQYKCNNPTGECLSMCIFYEKQWRQRNAGDEVHVRSLDLQRELYI